MARAEISLNRHWRFTRDDQPDAWYKGWDDSGWREVTLPHDWSVEEPFSTAYSSGTGYLSGGVGWYRTTFTLPEEARGKRVTVIFDGVYNHPQVWCNSYYLGKWAYGYTTFALDLTEQACFGDTPNVLAVRVNREQVADSRWFTGTGIYRKVRLVLQDPVCLARNGVFFTTPEVDAAQARFQVACTVCNTTGEPAHIALRCALRDGQEAAADAAQDLDLPAGGWQTVVLSGAVAQPRLWSPAQPHLYTLETQVLRDGVAVDSQCDRVGIRSFAFDPDEGFALNGQPMLLKGVCVHHDAGCLGAAVRPQVWRRRLEKLRDMGCNAIRMSHNPHMPELYDLCDEMGFLVMDEAFDEWEGVKNKWSTGHNVYPPKHYGYFEDFPQWYAADIREMVERDRNHPCVILWSIGNEIDYPNDPYCHPLFQTMTGNNDKNKPAAEREYDPNKPNAERLVTLARRLKAEVRRYDATRPVTAAAAFPELSNQTGLTGELDVVGYNYKEHLYPADHAAFPGHITLGSENGHSLAAWKAVADLPYISGQFLWTGIDYLGEAQGWPVHGSAAGLLTLAGFEKPDYYFRRSLWTEQPVAHLATARRAEGLSDVQMRRCSARTWNYAPGEKVAVYGYTNAAEGELFLNGESQGVRRMADFPDLGFLVWEVDFESGVLELVAGDARETLETTGAAVAIQAQPWQTSLAADGEDVAQIEIATVDAQGRPVWQDATLLSVAVEGPAVLLGLENGDLADVTAYTQPARRAYHGRAVAYLRSTGSQGVVRVRVEGEGLRPCEVALDAQ